MYLEPTRAVGAAAASYNLTGKQGWTYPACNSGYTKKSSGKAHPNAYTCFSTTPPTPTCPLPANSIYIEGAIKQAEATASAQATQDSYSMKGTSLEQVLKNYSTYKACSFYSELVMRATAAYNKTYTMRPLIMTRG